jgi:hypothetical protein
MGCLFELLVLPIEYLLELIIDGWFSLMQWIIPEKYINKGIKIVLRVVVWIVSFALLVTLIIGLLAALLTEATVFDLWKLIFIPLAIALVQIMLGVVVRYVINKNNI